MLSSLKTASPRLRMRLALRPTIHRHFLTLRTCITSLRTLPLVPRMRDKDSYSEILSESRLRPSICIWVSTCRCLFALVTLLAKPRLCSSLCAYAVWLSRTETSVLCLALLTWYVTCSVIPITRTLVRSMVLWLTIPCCLLILRSLDVLT